MRTEQVSKGISALYEPPCVDVLEVEVEKGFAASSDTGGNGGDWGDKPGEWE